MLVYKCDICKKELKDKDNHMSVSNRGFMSAHTICNICGKPILDFMKKHKLIEEDKKKK